MLAVVLQIALIVLIICIVLRPYLNHTPENHKAALFKAIFLWLFSTSPIIFAAFLSKPSSSGNNPFIQFFSDLSNAFSMSEAFIYCAAYLSPVLYVAIELIVKVANDDLELRKDEIRKEFRGLELVVGLALAVLLFTAFSFAAHKSNIADGETYLSLLLGGNGLYIYLISLGIWYTVILRETTPPINIGRTRSEESNELAERLRERSGEDW